MIDIARNIAALHTRISASQLPGGVPVTLLAVSKKQTADAIRAAVAAGQHQFGENYVQEAVDKILELRELELTWHFIGAIQTNKTRLIAEHFDWVQSVDRLKTAQRLAKQRPAGRQPLDICLQVNVDDEPGKAGISAGALLPLIEQVVGLERLRLRGLMAIPAVDQCARQGESFARMQRLWKRSHQCLVELDGEVGTRYSRYFDTLSMGMSADLEWALAHGATLVRVGSDIFGPRQ